MKEKVGKYGLPYGIILVALIVATYYDLTIAQCIYQPNVWWGIGFERFVLIPCLLLLIVACFGKARLHQAKRWYLMYAIVYAYSSYDTLQYWISFTKQPYVWIFVFLVACLLTYGLSKVPIAYWQRQERFFTFYIAVFISTLLIVAVLKQAWGRIRFRDLSDLALFTPWYLPQGITGNYSFPSGHSASIAVLLCFFDYYRCQRSYKKAPIWVSWLLILLIISMMVSRMVVGAHYLSDVTMGFCITYSLFLFYRKRFI